MDYWKISDFAKEVGKHQNTVDGWFKQLEENKIHWVNRSEYGEKVYTTLDLKIANFIKEKRTEKWALDVIFKELTKHFELRTVPEETTSVPQVLDTAMIRMEFEKTYKELAEVQLQEMKKAYQEMAAAQVQEMKHQYENLLDHLPRPKSIEVERAERTDDMIVAKRIEYKLKQEALNIWSTKPDNERKIKAGWFRRVEDINKRDQFISDYLHEHFEDRLKQAYGID